MNEPNPTIKSLASFRYLLLFLILECIGSLGWVLSTVTDQKNEFFLGYSLNRWIIITLILAVTLALTISIFNYSKVYKFFDRFIAFMERTEFLNALTAISAVLLWISIWISPNLVPSLMYEIERIKPVLILFFGIFFEILVYFQFRHHSLSIKDHLSSLLKNRKKLLLVLFFIFTPVVIYMLLKHFSSVNEGKSLSFPPGPPISPLNCLMGIIIFFILYFVTSRNKNSSPSKTRGKILILVLIWAVVFALWAATPLTCDDDRPGPYPPNNICYPQVDDSVYSIGSHYITLGRGVFNHWFTDKPFYMLFLAFGQWIAGPQIDRYLLFQIGILALIPTLLYLLGKKFTNFAGGFFLAFLAAVLGMNNIKYYAIAAGVNAKLENSEILTSLFLIIFCLTLIRFIQEPNRYKWLLISGGILGLATLTRINPGFIMPVVIVFLFFLFWKNWRKFISSSLALLIGFSIVFVPWLLLANDAQGQNHYLRKIEDVINSRYLHKITSTTNLGAKVNANVQPTLLVNYSIQKSGILDDKNEVIGSVYQDSLQQITPQSKEGVFGIFYHFLNNEYMSIARLPVNFSINQMPTLLRQPLWSDSHRYHFWKLDLSFENLLVLFINLLIVVIGIYFVVSRWGYVGLVPLIIQIGYHLANGFALASGERYLEPVEWVTLFYFVAGFYCITKFIFPWGVDNKISSDSIKVDSQIRPARSLFKNRENYFVLLGLFMIGLLLPATFLIPDKLSAKPAAVTIDNIKSILIEQKLASNSNFEQFLLNPKAVITEGFAYHPRTYRSPLVFRGQDIFEMTVLGKDNVYVSNSLNLNMQDYFPDETRVILLGCKMNQRDFWGAESVIIRTIGFVDLDHDEKVYMNKWVKLECK